MKPLAKALISRMPQLTVLRSAETALENAKRNQPDIRLTIGDLAAAPPLAGHDSAIVIAAGPSLHRHNPVAEIVSSGYEGDIVAADGALGYCLRNGLVPDYVVTLDPHPTRICRWFGDQNLASRRDGDDYFRRQDLDPHLGTDELARNQELLALVNRHGPSIKAVICTSADRSVATRCREAGMTLYWWNPLMDDVDRRESVARALYRLNKVPCMVSGGNVGSAAWVFTHQVLRRPEVAVVGMDLSYPPGTPLTKTQYYTELKALFGDRAEEAMTPIQNPHTQETWHADPAYFWYRSCFLELAAQAPCTTFNCTEGGVLFGDGVEWMPLREFLASRSPARQET